MKNQLLQHSRFTLIAMIVSFAAALTLTACRTMEGAGKDIERAGEKIQENAK